MKRMRSRLPATGLTSTFTRGKLAQMPDTEPIAQIRHDVFQKARDHERKELIELARREDLLPYFRQVESEAGPVVRMARRERLMLGANNYLGRTAEPPAQAASC